MSDTSCFEKLNIKLSENNPLFKDYKTFEYKQIEVGIFHKSRTFRQFRVSASYFENEPIGEVIKKFNLVPTIFLIEAGYCYNWHRDAFRFAAYNMMLSDDPNYVVAFAPEYTADLKVEAMPLYTPITQLIYEPRNFYVLNTQIAHLSINCSNTDRYILTLASYIRMYGSDIRSGNRSYYNEVIEELKKLNFIDDTDSNTNI